MAVRNFYVRGSVDGRQTDISAGPRNRSGGMTLTITQRNKGSIETAYRIHSYSLLDGGLATRIFDGSGALVHETITQRDAE